MREGFGFIIFIAIGFIAWLMWSGNGQKETFLGFAWVAMIVVGTIGTLYEFFTR